MKKYSILTSDPELKHLPEENNGICPIIRSAFYFKVCTYTCVWVYSFVCKHTENTGQPSCYLF